MVKEITAFEKNLSLDSRVAIRLASNIDESDEETDDFVALVNRESKVVKSPEKDEWCVKSENNPDWSGGCYDSKKKAEKRLQQVEYFKHSK